MEKKKVLCVCAGNTCRSPMMAALLQKELGDGFEVESAGLFRHEHLGGPASPETVMILAELGIDLGSHRSRWIGDVNVDEFEYLICVHWTPFIARLPC